MLFVEYFVNPYQPLDLRTRKWLHFHWRFFLVVWRRRRKKMLWNGNVMESEHKCCFSINFTKKKEFDIIFLFSNFSQESYKGWKFNFQCINIIFTKILHVTHMQTECLWFAIFWQEYFFAAPVLLYIFMPQINYFHINFKMLWARYR